MMKDLTREHPDKILWRFLLPMLVSVMFQQIYNIADSCIAGRFAGEDALAAVGASYPITVIFMAFAVGTNLGASVVVSRLFGAKDMVRMKSAVSTAFIACAFMSFFLTFIGYFFCGSMMRLVHTPENIFADGRLYLKIYVYGITFLLLYNVCTGIFTALGDSKTPLYFLILSSFLNIVLDLFLIVVVKLGTAGAAYATIIAQGVSALLCFIYMFRKFDILKTSREDYYLDGYGVFNMLSIGIPMALNYSITAIGTMILQGAVNIFGSSVVAAFTAASKVENLSTQTMPTLGTAIATYCGQNLGAGKYKRIYEGMRKGFFICIFISLAASAICVFGGRFIVSWFVSNPSEEIFDYAMQYLNTISFFMLPLAWIFLYRNALQGLNRGLVPMLSGVVEMVCRIIVIAVTLNPFGYWAVRLASPITWLITGILLIVTYFIWEKQSRKKHSGSSD